MRQSLRGSAGLLAVAVFSAAVLVGCGSSGSKPEGGGSVSAAAYVGQVCTSLASWYNGIQSRGSKIESEIGPHTTPQQSRTVLESFISTSVADTESVVNSLRSAGTPDVANGQKVADGLVSAFEKAKFTFEGLQSRVAHMSSLSDHATLEEEAKRIRNSVEAAPLTLATGVASVSSAELNKAAAESNTCKNVGGHSKPS
jgi:hypothetical protein